MRSESTHLLFGDANCDKPSFGYEGNVMPHRVRGNYGHHSLSGTNDPIRSATAADRSSAASKGCTAAQWLER
jgi:hypothetical protein